MECSFLFIFTNIKKPPLYLVGAVGKKVEKYKKVSYELMLFLINSSIFLHKWSTISFVGEINVKYS